MATRGPSSNDFSQGDINRARGQRHAGSGHGSASKPPASAKPPPSPSSPASSQRYVSTLARNAAVNKYVTQWNDPYPLYQPMLNPGVRGVRGTDYAVGFMYSPPGVYISDQKNTNPTNPYGFRFHYNPNDITMSSEADAALAAMPNFGIGQGNPLTLNLGACSFNLFINRQDEVAQNRVARHITAGTDKFSELGTIYDIAWLYRVFSGDELVNLQPDTWQPPLLLPTTVRVQFSNRLSFYGRIIGVVINHLLYNAAMVPLISTVNISLAGLIEDGTLENQGFATASRGKVTPPAGTHVAVATNPGPDAYQQVPGL